jgi:translin
MIDEIFVDIRKKLDVKNELRESYLSKTRKIINMCGIGIKYIHSENFEAASSSIDAIRGLIDELIKNIDEDNLEFLYKGNTSTMYQEFTELVILFNLIKHDKFLSPDEIGVPEDSYLLGVCDVIGELKRHCLNSIRKEDLNMAEKSLKLMEDIFENLTTLYYPNALIPNLRHKTDIGRILVEKTRTNVTMAWVMSGKKE